MIIFNSYVRAVLLAFLFLSSSHVMALEAFFDEDIRTRYAPQEPELTDLDLDVLMLCGDWGAEVKAVDFETMMRTKGNQAVVTRLRKALGNRIFSKAKNDRDFIHQLRRVWFEQKGFQHVFCGEPDRYSLGGFHYAARYWQAQDKGWAGYRKLAKNINQRPIAKCQKFYLQEKINDPVYSVSIAYIAPQTNRQKVKCLSGYNREMNAERLLLAGTRAFKQANRRVGKNTKEACWYQTRQKGIKANYNQMVIKQRALRTFYPIADKRPYCRKNKKNISACLCSNL